MVHLVSTGPTSGPTQAATRNPFHMHVTVLVPSSREEVLHHMLVITIIVRVQHNIILLDHNIGSLTTHSGTIRTAIQEAIAAITPKLLGLLGDLNTPTQDDVEIRWCSGQGHVYDRVGTEVVEIYVY